MSYYPKLSIVTPSYNQVQFLESAINSVLSQNYPNLEYIVIDGGSTDGSVDIIKKYERHLTYWCSETDAGHYDAINKGFKHASGDILAWLNSDDMYFPWAFKTVADIMRSLPKVKWLSTLTPGYWDYYGFCKGFGKISGFSLEAFLDGCYLPFNNPRGIAWIQQESTFWARELWESVGSCLNADIKLAGDFDLWCRFYTKEKLFGVVSPLGGFRSQYQQKSRNIETYAKEALESLSCLRNLMGWSPERLRNVLLNERFMKVPKLRTYLVDKLGYRAERIIRLESDKPGGTWDIEENKFYGNLSSR